MTELQNTEANLGLKSHPSLASVADTGLDHRSSESRISCSPVVGEIIEAWRQRVDLHKAEKSLTLQTKAMCWRLVGDSMAERDKLYAAVIKDTPHDLKDVAATVTRPFLEARVIIAAERKLIEKRLATIVQDLPAYEFIEGIRGLSSLSLAGLVGEAGDLVNYENPAKLWKRMGLAVLDGNRQRLVKGAEAIRQGYVPRRRAVVWNMGDCIIKAQSQKIDKETGEVVQEAGHYREIYDRRKEYEWPRVQESKSPKGHAHNRAKRYMEKQLLVDIWENWRGLA